MRRQPVQLLEQFKAIVQVRRQWGRWRVRGVGSETGGFLELHGALLQRRSRADFQSGRLGLPGADIEITNNASGVLDSVTSRTKWDARGRLLPAGERRKGIRTNLPNLHFTWQGGSYTLNLHPKDEAHSTEQRFTPGKQIVQDYDLQIGGEYGGTLKAHAYDPNASLTAPRQCRRAARLR